MKNISSYIILVFIIMALHGCNLQDPYNELFVSGEELKEIAENYSQIEKEQNLEDANLKSAGISTVNIKGSFALSTDSEPYPGTIISLDITGIGNTSHMGRTNLVIKKTVIVDQRANPPVWDAFAEIIITTARGDKIYCNYEGCNVDLSQTPNLAFQTECVVSGGTGRFEDATGILNYYEVFSWSESTGILKIDGDISF